MKKAIGVVARSMLFLILSPLLFACSDEQSGSSGWTVRTSGTNETLSDVIWSGSLFVAAGGNGTILTSPDGVEWTARASGTDSYLSKVVWSGKQFLAARVLGCCTGLGHITTSLDGINWTSADPGTGNIAFSDLTWSGTRFILVGTHDGTILSSSDGANWVKRHCGYGWLFSVASSGNMIVAAGWGGICTSQDGLNWTRRELNPRGDWPGDSIYVVWDGTRFLAVGSVGQCFTSQNGLEWHSVSLLPVRFIGDLKLAGSLFFAWPSSSVNTGLFFTSPDGAEWTTHSVKPDLDLNDVAYSGSKYVIVGSGGSILTSSDGADWKRLDSGTTKDLNSIAWSGSRFVAVGSDGTIVTSP